jgi:transcriptional regulator with XRE-family HTH domain
VAKSRSSKYLKSVGDNIRRVRNALGMTQEELAELADLNVRSLRRIEAGEMNILITTLARVRNALGCSWQSILPRDW